MNPRRELPAPALPGWPDWVDRLRAVLAGMAVSDGAGAPLEVEAGFRAWVARTREAKAAAGRVFLIGNGASAAMASHFACDVGKNAHLDTQVFTDPAMLTAMGNDVGYEQVFAGPLRIRGRPGDLLVAISSSGKSPNVLAGCRAARERGLQVVTLSGMRPENPLRSLGQLNFWLPAGTYGEAETGHAAVLHRWTDLVLAVEGEP